MLPMQGPGSAQCVGVYNGICYAFLHNVANMKISVRRKQQPARQISWEQILINLDAGVVTVDLDGKIGFFNEAAEVLTEISSAATLGQALEQIFKPDPGLFTLGEKTRRPRQKRLRAKANFLTLWVGRIPAGVTVSRM